MMDLVFWSIWGLHGVAMFFYYMRRFHIVRSILIGGLSGWTALVLLHYFGGVIAFCPELNLFNFLQAAILGVPGVIMMTVLHFVL